jgi:hypothetical protein
MKRSIIIFILLACFLGACQQGNGPKEVPFAMVKFESDGCFGSDRCLLEIKTKGGESFAFLTCEAGKTRQVKVNGVQLQAFERLITELREVKEEGFCTTQSRYEVTYRTETFRKVDKGCSSEGFSRLRKAWFED